MTSPFASRNEVPQFRGEEYIANQIDPACWIPHKRYADSYGCLSKCSPLGCPVPVYPNNWDWVGGQLHENKKEVHTDHSRGALMLLFQSLNVYCVPMRIESHRGKITVAMCSQLTNRCSGTSKQLILLDVERGSFVVATLSRPPR
jgi:hypothetical protein